MTERVRVPPGGCRACGGPRPAPGTDSLCPRCTDVLHQLTVGKPAPAMSFPPTARPEVVFPDQMEARCVNGHTWLVEMVWGSVPGAAADVRMRFPERWFPFACPRCAFVAVGFQRLPDAGRR